MPPPSGRRSPRKAEKKEKKEDKGSRYPGANKQQGLVERPKE